MVADTSLPIDLRGTMSHACGPNLKDSLRCRTWIRSSCILCGRQSRKPGGIAQHLVQDHAEQLGAARALESRYQILQLPVANHAFVGITPLNVDTNVWSSRTWPCFILHPPSNLQLRRVLRLRQAHHPWLHRTTGTTSNGVCGLAITAVFAVLNAHHKRLLSTFNSVMESSCLMLWKHFLNA